MRIEENQKQTGVWKNHLIAAILLMAFAFFINRGIEIKGLYMDDLYMWSCFGEQSFQEFVFPIGGTRCRFIFYLASYLEMVLMGANVNWMVPINILLNGGVAITIYWMAGKISRSGPVAFLTGILYLLSRLSYYQISQGWGLMETMALWMAIGILYCLYQFLNDHPKSKQYYLTANILYFAVCFVHERYMVLVPLFFIVVLLKRRKDVVNWLLPIGMFILVQVVRLIVIGGLLPAGTGGTQVTEAFSMGRTIGFALSQVAYLFGINAGPEYLNGIAFMDTPIWLRGLVYASIAMVVILFLCFLATAIRKKEERIPALHNSLLFICFIGACIASSSVTIRLEMRWVYVSFAAALLYLGYMYGTIVKHLDETKAIKRLVPYGTIFLAYAVLLIPVETYYRSHYDNLYYWPNQLRYNSLAEETYEKYGDDIFDKTVYIIGNTYEMSDFTAETFFKVYDKEKLFQGPNVVFIDSIKDVGLVTDQMIILREESKFNAFQDITEFVNDLKCHRIYGYYEDGWMDEEAKVSVMAGSTGRIELELVYPGNLTGQEQSVLYVNGEETTTIEFHENIIYTTIEAKPHETVELKFVNNFHMKDAQEQRGEKRFSMIVNMKAN